ncbi:hypothetical protein K466DRAFT_288640 [Polyporus arcularius HHB13444]|uniref:Uncharacterized protein n=1 Tax=Polyporus arcularius HHB13444 TaxID=1314778 RepID=A0A5C3P293_9APHY|nr:hypothetical protein K466DRAFT_288640 [Polyporus arcularius HHB13444]
MDLACSLPPCINACREYRWTLPFLSFSPLVAIYGILPVRGYTRGSVKVRYPVQHGSGTRAQRRSCGVCKSAELGSSRRSTLARVSMEVSCDMCWLSCTGRSV